MKAISREKIALLVFCLLMIAGAGALAFYLFAGHSWNYAATSLDDSFGNMDGYAAIVFEGTAQPEEDTDAEDGEATDAETEDNASTPATGAGASGEDGSPDASQEAGVAGESAQSAEAPETEDSETAEEGSMSAEAEDGGTAFPLPFASTSSSKQKPATTETVRKSYEEKGADVFVLDSADIDAYADGVVMQSDGYRIGVMSASYPRSTASLEKLVERFKESKVDFIVALVANDAYLAGVSGVDVVIATNGDGSSPLGQTVGNSYRVFAPEIGSVGVVLISPSNVVSAKVIDEL